MNDISSEDNIPFYDKFVEDVARLESANGVLSPNSELRNDIVTFISENYTPREAGHMICPACLTETPNILFICIRCHGTLVSWGEKEADKDESTAPGMPERELLNFKSLGGFRWKWRPKNLRYCFHDEYS